MGIVVREAIEADLNAIMTIARTDVNHLGFEPRGAYLESIKQFKLLVAIWQQNNKNYVIGFIKFGGTTKDMWTIYQVATARIARGKGAGKALIDSMTNLATQHGAGIRLKVTTENAVAVGFYQHIGFSIIATEKPNKRTLYVMEKPWQP